MINDETFPSDFFISDEEPELEFQVIKLKSTNGSIQSSNTDQNSMSSAEDLNSSTELEQSMINSMETDRLLKSSDFQNTIQSINDTENIQPEASFESTRNINILPPPRAPIKKKKSFSCQNLNIKKNGSSNYDHVESKVKKLIENLAEDRRKTLMRHKSMPVCVTQTPVIDEKPELEKDLNDLKRELRRKSIKIYELEEKCELKDNQIYDLEREKSKMRMIFDKLRVEMQELKEVETQYRHLKSQCSPHNKTQRNAIIQTDDSGIDSDYSRVNILRDSVTKQYKDTNRALIHPVIRQLAFENSNLDQSHFSEINNTSSDNLIPEIELQLENIIDNSDAFKGESRQNHIDEELKAKKKKRKLKFFSFVPCVSK